MNEFNLYLFSFSFILPVKKVPLMKKIWMWEGRNLVYMTIFWA